MQKKEVRGQSPTLYTSLGVGRKYTWAPQHWDFDGFVTSVLFQFFGENDIPCDQNIRVIHACSEHMWGDEVKLNKKRCFCESNANRFQELFLRLCFSLCMCFFLLFHAFTLRCLTKLVSDRLYVSRWSIKVTVARQTFALQ